MVAKRRPYNKYVHIVGKTTFADIIIEDTKTSMIIKSRRTGKKLVYPIPTSFLRRRSYIREAGRILMR